MRKDRFALFIVSVLVIAVVASGCFGNRSPKPPPNREEVSNLSGTVTAPQSIIDNVGTLGITAQNVSGFVPLPGASVQAFSLPELTHLGNPVETDENGQYTITGLPKGTKVIIVATKSIGDAAIRLTTYVPSVGDNTSADVDPVTSLTTEILASKVSDGLDPDEITEDVWAQLYAEAEAVVQALGDIDVTIGGDLFPEEFGSGIADADLVEQIWPPELEPNPDADVALAKELARLLRDAGYSLQDTIESQVAAHMDSINNEVVPFVAEISDEYFRLLMAIDLIDVLVNVEQQPPGSYELDFETMQFYGPIDTYDTYQWVVSLTNFPITLTAIFDNVQDDVSNFRFTLDTSGDDRYRHVVDLDHFIVDGRVSSVTGSYTMFEGSEREAVMDGTATIISYLEVDDGEIPHDVTFEGTIKSNTINLTGQLEMTFVPTPESEDWVARVEDATFNGAIVTQTLSFVGTGKFDFVDPPETFLHDSIAAFLNQATFSGKLADITNGEFVVLDGELSYSLNNLEELDFTQPVGPDNYSNETISFNGKISVSEMDDDHIELSLLIESIRWGELDATLTLSRGNLTLQGSALYEYYPSGELQHLTLTDEARGLLLTFSYVNGVPSGSITKDGETVATIRPSTTGIVIDYRDGTYHSIF